MKSFFKTFLILIFALFSLGIGNCNAENLYLDTANASAYKTRNTAQDILLLSAIPNKDMAIASSNNNGYEIYSFKNDTECRNGVYGNSVLSNNNSEQKLVRILNRNINCNSHNISPLLGNEICTRAP